jgi:DNA modification methylase
MLRSGNSREIPEEFRHDDFRSNDEVVEYFIKEYTNPGDTVLDIFAGLGTTLLVAEELGRVPFGVELDADLYAYVKSQIQNKDNLIHGDSRKLREYKIPKADFVFTSPIFMNKHETKDPLDAFRSDGTYEQYLYTIQKIFSDLNAFLKPTARVVVEVANLKKDEVTTLAWDVGKAISNSLRFVGEVVVGWIGPDEGQGTFGTGYDHCYCLVFTP